MRIRKIKKIIVVIIITTMLQTQLVSLTNIAWAINMEMTGEGKLDTDMSEEVMSETTITEETPSENVTENLSDEGTDENVQMESEENLEETANVPSEENQEMAEDPVVEPKIELNMTSENSSIYKGYLYANATSDLRYETKYNTIQEVKIEGSQNGITNLVVKENEDKIKMITDTKMALLNGIYYKKTRVSVQEFNSLLGEKGIINVFDADGDFVGCIDSQSPVENGYYTYEFIYYTNSVKFELSTPIADGSIRIINDKAIKEDTLYSREQIATFSTINIMADAEMIIGENILTTSAEGDITLQETEAKVEMELDKTELSTEDENELTMTLTLKTDAERYELFKNPVIEVEMPSSVNELSIEGVNLLYKNGLSLKNWEVIQNDSGNKVLRIEMEGAQSVYTPGIVQQGTTLVVYLKANVNKLTANTSETLKLRYTNQDSVRQAYVLEGKDAEELVLTFVAKHGMLKGATATNLNTSTTGKSYEDEVDKVEIKSNVKEQTVTLTGTIVNNFEKEVEDVVIVGRIPFMGNKNGNGDELLSDFDTVLKSEILTSGNITEIYYSENGDAGKDDESWTQDITDMSKYKSYKIVVKEGTLKKGEKVEFSYEVTVPDNLGYNLKSYSTYTVIYKLDNQELSGNCTIALVTETKELEADDLENKEEVEKLKIGTQVTQGGRVLAEGDSVYERQILRYTVVVTNTSKETLTNVKLTGRAENANMYTWLYTNHPGYNGLDEYIVRKMVEDTDGTIGQEELVIERLEPGESSTFEYQVIVKELVDESEEFKDTADDVMRETTDVYGVITVEADNIEQKQIETIKNYVKESQVELRVEWSGTESVTGTESVSNAKFPFNVYVNNLYEEDLINVEVNVLIPSELELDINNEFAIYNPKNYEFVSKNVESGNIITFTIPKLKAKSSDAIYFSASSSSINIQENSKLVTILAFAQIDENVIYSNDYIRRIYQGETAVEHTWKADYTGEILNDGQIITYEFSLKNIGVINSGRLSIKVNAPYGLIIENTNAVINGEEHTVSIETDSLGLNYIVDDISLDSQEEYILRIIGEVDANIFERDQESIDMKVSVYGGNIDAFETDVISYKINNENVTVEITENEKDDNTETDVDIDSDNDNTNSGTNEELGDDTNNEINTKPDNEKDNSNSQDNSEENTTTPKPEDEIKKENEMKEQTETYRISGKVWLDKDKDGINKNESGMESVVVILYKTTDKGNITSKIQETATNSQGEYVFTGVESGNYVVVFSYDTSLYNSTKYRVSTATSAENSDAITKAIEPGNIAGITDVIKIDKSGAINVDLGLVNKNEFDLSLEKYIDYTKVINKDGTKINKYEEKSNVKLEIHSKFYKDSTIEIAYKIRVINTGEVIGYINKIVDYVPEKMKFDNNKNPDWYYGDDGNLYYKGLVGTELAPGVTKEITLILTKVLDDGETVKLVNSAEISDCTNSLGLEDIDSVPNNKELQEDDLGRVTLIVTISTGSEIKNILIAIVITLSIVAITVYIYKLKFVKKVYR